MADDPTPSAPQAENDSRNDAAHPDGNAVSEVKIPPSHKCYPQACKKKRDGWDIAKLVAEFIGLAFLIIYTLYTAGIYCANRKAAKVAHDTLVEIRRQFKTEAMAQVVVKNIQWRIDEEAHPKRAKDEICSPDGVKKHFCFWFDLDNGGKTPATETATTVRVAGATPNQIEDVHTRIDKFHVPLLGDLEGHDPMSVGSHRWSEFSVDEICESGDCIRQKDATEMIAGGQFLYIYGIIRYRDVFQHQHATRFCFIRPRVKGCTFTAGGCMNPCPFGNWLDKRGDVPAPED